MSTGVNGRQWCLLETQSWLAMLANSCVLLQPVSHGCVGVCCFVVLTCWIPRHSLLTGYLDTELRPWTATLQLSLLKLDVCVMLLWVFVVVLWLSTLLMLRREKP